MRFESVRSNSPSVSAHEAVSRGLAPDGGLYMPESIPRLPDGFMERARKMSYSQIAFEISKLYFSPEIPEKKMRKICDEAFNFPVPINSVEPGIDVMELYHGPTAAFKDFGARFMSRVLGHFAKEAGREVTILVATSGDTGSAVAHGFHNVPGINVKILYPKGKVSPLQEKQLTGITGNVQAFEVDGVFDDCQKMVKEALNDAELNEALTLSSANSINIARLVPQMTYYAYLAARYPEGTRLLVSVPSGNLGDITAGVIAKKMGVPIERFVAATNINDVMPGYLYSGLYRPRPSQPTISNAMDVGDPSNFARLEALYHGSAEEMSKDIFGIAVTDGETRDAIKEVFDDTGYIMDPHGAVAYVGLRYGLARFQNHQGVFLETADPAKFAEVVEPVIGEPVPMPDRLAEFLTREKQATPIPPDFNAFKAELLK